MPRTKSPAVNQPGVRSLGKTDWQITFALTLFLFAVYLFTTGLRFQSIDEYAVYSVTRSLLGHGSFDTDILVWVEATLGPGSVVAQGIDGHSYAVKDILPSLLIAPPMLLARVLPVSPARAAFIVPPIITAATGALVFVTARCCNFRTLTALSAGLIFGLGSSAWPYSETLHTQPVAGLGLALGLLGSVLSRRQGRARFALIGGIGMGIASASLTPALALTPIHCLFLMLPSVDAPPGQWQWKKATRLILPFLVGLTPFILMQGIYNGLRFGNPMHTGHQETGGVDFNLSYLITGLFGQLLSAPRGLLWYAPLVVLVPTGVVLAGKEHKGLILLACAQAIGILLIYSSFAKWWGGVSWGPRFLVPVMPAVALIISPVLERTISSRRIATVVPVIAILLTSIVTQVFSTLLDPLDGEHQIAATLETLTPPHEIIPTHPIYYDPRTLPWPRLWSTLQIGHWDTLWLFGGQLDGLAMAVLLTLILASLWLLRLTAARPATRSLGRALVGQCIFTVTTVLFLLIRYSDSPMEPPTFDGIVQTVHAQAEHRDALVVLLPYDIGLWVANYDSTVQDIGAVYEDPLSAQTSALLESVVRDHSRVWLISQGTVGGNPANGVEVWLSQYGFVGTERWDAGIRLVPYTFSGTIGPLITLNRTIGESGLLLRGYAYELAHGSQSRWLNVWLRWQTDRTQTTNYAVFVHLLAEDGRLVTQHDGWPRAAFSPISSWQPGISVDDRHYLPLPLDIASGRYTLVVGLYDQATGQRLSVDSNSDYVELAEVVIP